MLKQRPKFWIRAYDHRSQAARLLARALGGKIILRRNSRYSHQLRDLVINWGCSQAMGNIPMLNRPECVARATSKMDTFRNLAEAGVQIPEWTQDHNLASQWAQRGRLLGRDLDRGARGKGITVYSKGDVPKEHTFYVRYMQKDREFRVHVVQGTVIFVQEKLRKKGEINVDPFIRSHRFGWCFAFHHLNEQPAPQAVLDSGVAAVRALGLDFGAVDLAWSERSGATVLEVNSAPGIEESSLVAYADAFQRIL